MSDAPPFFPSAETRLPPSSSSSSSSSSPSLSNLSPSIIITLMVLSVAIIVTTCLCLLFRHLHRLPLPRCLLHRRLSTSSSSSSSSSSSPPLRASAPPPQDGAAVVHDESFIDSLPLFSFSSVTRRSSSAADGDCAVCLCKFKPHDLLRLLPLCCHAFHAECIDTWLQGNRTCPLCRSNVHACEADLEALLQSSARIHAGGDVGGGGGGSFRLEIGSVSRRRSSVDGDVAEARRSYSIGSFDYVVDADSEVAVAGDRHRRSVSDKEDGAAHLAASIAMDASLAADVASGRSWLGDYVDRLSATLSSRTASFRSSRRFFSGSSRRSDASAAGFVSDWDLEASRVGEEISELFRWASGV